MPFWWATSQAASMISRRAALRRSATLSCVGEPNMIRRIPPPNAPCQEARNPAPPEEAVRIFRETRVRARLSACRMRGSADEPRVEAQQVALVLPRQDQRHSVAGPVSSEESFHLRHVARYLPAPCPRL